MDKTFMVLILLLVTLLLYATVSDGGWLPKFDKYLPKIIFFVGLILIILFGVKILSY